MILFFVAVLPNQIKCNIICFYFFLFRFVFMPVGFAFRVSMVHVFPPPYFGVASSFPSSQSSDRGWIRVQSRRWQEGPEDDPAAHDVCVRLEDGPEARQAFRQLVGFVVWSGQLSYWFHRHGILYAHPDQSLFLLFPKCNVSQPPIIICFNSIPICQIPPNGCHRIVFFDGCRHPQG